jgi:MFS superfamily sulfate permease-like transporter
MDFSVLARYARVRRSSVALSVIATVGVVLFGVLQGILVAIALSILLFFRRNWWPHGAVLGRVDELGGWHSAERYPDSVQVPGVVVYRWDAPLFFANSSIFLQQIRRIVREQDVRWVVLQCEAITDVDLTAAEMLRRLDDELNSQGVHLAFVELRARLGELVADYGLHETLDREHFYPTIQAALADIGRRDTGPAE